MKNHLLLFANLPALLRMVWGMMLLGWPLAFAGMFLRSGWIAWTGAGLLMVAFALAVADLLLRKRHRERAAGFHTGLCIGAVAGVVIMALVAVLCLATYVVVGFVHGFSLAYGLRLLAFLGLLYAGGIIHTIGRQAKWLPQAGVKRMM